MVDLDVVRNMSPEVQRQYNIDKESLFKQTRYVHALDRKQIRDAQIIMGVSGSEQFNFTLVHNLDQITFNGIIELNTALVSCFDNPLATPKNPEFLALLNDELSYGILAKIFRESVAHIYPANTNTRDAIQHSGNNVNFHLKNCFNILKELDVDISNLHKYNERDVVRFSDKDLIYSKYNPFELLNYKTKMDALAQQLHATVGVRDRYRIFPIKEVIKDALGLNIYSVSQEQHLLPSMQYLLPSIEQSAITQKESSTFPDPSEGRKEEQSFTAGIDNLSLTQEELSTSPVGEEVSLTPFIEQSATTQKESSSPSVSKKKSTSPTLKSTSPTLKSTSFTLKSTSFTLKSTFPTLKSTSPTSRGKGRVQSSSTDSQKSNTKGIRLKKPLRFQFDKNSKVFTVRSKTGNNE